MSVQFARRQAEHLIERWSGTRPPVDVERLGKDSGFTRNLHRSWR